MEIIERADETTNQPHDEPGGNDYLEVDRELLRVRLEETESALTCRAVAAADHAMKNMRMIVEMRQLVRGLADLVKGRAGMPVYLVSSLFLRESYAYLVKDPSENMHFVTGSELGRCRVMERMVTFNKTTRTPVGVKGDPASTHKALIGLTESGHRLVAWLHSHPGSGAAATTPSGTDLGHQARLEQGGYPAIGGIFSRDGHIRFFSNGMPFTVRIHGSGIRKINEHIYQLDAD